MINEVIEQNKYYTCDDIKEIEVSNFKENDIIKTEKEEYKIQNGELIQNFMTTGRTGTVNVFTEPVIIVKSNMSREKITIQNNGTYPVLLKITDIVANDNYDYILKPSTVRKYGDGGIFTSNTIKMQISAMAIDGETTLSILEEVLY